MTRRDPKPKRRLLPGSLGGQLAVLTLLQAALLGVVAPLAWQGAGPQGFTAAAVAAVACLLAGAGALVVLRTAGISQHTVAGPLLAMAVRMSVPLLLCVAVYTQGGPLVDAGLVWYVLIFYPAMLWMETVLAARCAVSAMQQAKA